MAVMGTLDTDWLMDRVSAEAAELLGCPVSEVLGHPLLGLIADHHVAACSSALTAASSTGRAATLCVELRVTGSVSGTVSGSVAVSVELILLPMQPSPSCAFVLLPTSSTATPQSAVLTELSVVLGRLGEDAHEDVPELDRLTPRELEIVKLLLDGERPPAIAFRLFVSQSTVRNHLASVFAKFGVASQQELLAVFRRRGSR